LNISRGLDDTKEKIDGKLVFCDEEAIDTNFCLTSLLRHASSQILIKNGQNHVSPAAGGQAWRLSIDLPEAKKNHVMTKRQLGEARSVL
jgi:hypothetical protein